jgi:hypothetical protein
MPEQYYLFTLPGDELVWCEMYTSDGHYVAPTPYSSAEDALTYLSDAHPHATVDTLCDQADIEECQRWARECPLEPIAASSR